MTCDVCLQVEHSLKYGSFMRSCRYIATIDGAVSKQHLFSIGEGTVIDSVHCTPDSVELLLQPDITRPCLCIMVFFFF